MWWLKLAMRWVLGLIFVLAGVNHFVNPAFYVRIMPPYLPWHRELVYLSGVFEIVLGALLLVPRYSSLAAWGIVAMLVVFTTVHVHMVANADLFPNVSPALLWGRLALQPVLIAWAYWFTSSLPVP